MHWLVLFLIINHAHESFLKSIKKNSYWFSLSVFFIFHFHWFYCIQMAEINSSALLEEQLTLTGEYWAGLAIRVPNVSGAQC